MKRRTIWILAAVAAFPVFYALGRLVGPQAIPVPPRARETKAEAAPRLVDNDVAKEKSRAQFVEYCEQAVRAKLSMPASFKPHDIMSGPPWQVTWPADHTTTWEWAFNFEASNAYGAVGTYKGSCGQGLDGRVVASIRLTD